jgi:phosphatidylserine/phosphatidylglycerophosphate/cardiolipin synthase-like enzyme
MAIKQIGANPASIVRRRTVGRMDQTDNPQALVHSLVQMIRDKRLHVRVYTKGRMHAKAYIFDYRDDGRYEKGISIVGSSNLTLSGLTHNTELNVVVHGNENHAKLIELGVDYAADLGFKPHKDYHKTKIIFGTIDAALCDEYFEFGQDGKPFYGSGPNESPEQSRRIVDALTKRCGPDGFHFMVADQDFLDDEFDKEEIDEIDGE